MLERMRKPENRKWLTLAAVVPGLFMIMLDNTVVNVALVPISKSLHTGNDELEWVVNAYALVFGVLLLSGGKVADLIGRRRVFTLGMGLFALASLGCGLANSAGTLITARALQGIGAALMNPASLSIITATFPPRERGRAIGIWAGVSAMALAIGPLVGGFITQHWSWSWIFFINVPIGALAIVAARLLIDESRDTSQRQRLDLPGLVTSGIGLFGLTFALIEGNRLGWSSQWILLGFAGAVLGLGLFVLLEQKQQVPMLDLSLFRHGAFAGANLVMLLVGLSMFGVFFFMSIYMQFVLGYSPVQAGASFLPMTILVMFVAPNAGKLSDRVGPRWIIAGGMVSLSLSLLLFGRLGTHATFWSLLPAMIFGGVGMGSAMAPTTAAAMASVPIQKAGIGSAVINAMRQVGGTLGIALMGAIMATRWHEGDRSVEHYVAGMHRGLHVAAAITFCASIVAALLIRNLRHAEHPATAPEPA